MADPVSWGMIATTALSAGGSIADGRAQRKDAEDMADQYRQKAVEAEGEANRKAHEIRRQGKIMESDTVAAMVASGGMASDAGAQEHLAKLQTSAELGALDAVFQGDVLAKQYRKQARELESQGQDAERMGMFKGVTTAIGGAVQLPGFSGG